MSHHLYCKKILPYVKSKFIVFQYKIVALLLYLTLQAAGGGGGGGPTIKKSMYFKSSCYILKGLYFEQP